MLPQVGETHTPQRMDASGERLLYDETSRNVQMYIHWFVDYKFRNWGSFGHHNIYRIHNSRREVKSLYSQNTDR